MIKIRLFNIKSYKLLAIPETLTYYTYGTVWKILIILIKRVTGSYRLFFQVTIVLHLYIEAELGIVVPIAI